jgi:hypothetical protein
MRLPDGTRASTPEESAGVFATHFTQLYGRLPSGNAAVLELLQQRSVTPGLDGEPSDEEIRIALRKLHRRVAANRSADYAPRQDEENLTGWLICQCPLTPLWL